jgi:ribosomal protein S18 acetylase RimI-like enzyme
MKLEIVDFREDLSDDFAALNYEWIEKYFAVEEHDREILEHPRKFVLDPGGMIFFALVEATAAGTVALIPADDGTLELTKMAVSPRFQGIGIGGQLISKCIEYATSKHVKKIWLESHTSLTPAISLYRKFGFTEVPGDPNSHYRRADIRMELAIEGTSM